MADRTKDWFRQAEHDLKHAQDSHDAGSHEWACFAAHQAAEKAVKALHLYHKQEARGHAIARLLQELPSSCEPPAGLIEKARVLDVLYIPTRYPNGLPEGAPFEHFSAVQSKEGIRDAREILEFVRFQMA